MSDALTKVAALHAIHGDCILLKEGGKPVVLLQNFGFTAADRRDDGSLLLPAPHSGYITRLFFERQIRAAAPTGIVIAWLSANGGRRRGTTSGHPCRGRPCSPPI